MKRARCFFVAASVFIALAVSCSHDHGIEPKPKPPDKDYIVYSIESAWGDWIRGTKFYGYHTLTGVIDSFVIPGHDCRNNGCAVSPDGALMYLYDGASILTVDLATREIVAEHPWPNPRGLSHPLIISPDGGLLVLQGYNLTILSIPDCGVVFSDTVQAANGYFTPDSRYFYCGAFINGSLASYRVDLSNSFAVTAWFPPYGGAYMTVPSPDGTKLFLYIWVYNEYFKFCVHDIAGDSLVYAQTLLPGFGTLAPTPDERYLIVTQQSPMFGEYPSPMKFTIFDIQQNDIFKEVSTLCMTEDSLKISSDLGFISITPDGAHMVNEWCTRGFDFNLKTMKYERTIKLGSDNFMVCATCQSQP